MRPASCPLEPLPPGQGRWVIGFLQARGLQRVEFWREAPFVWTVMGAFTFATKRPR